MIGLSHYPQTHSTKGWKEMNTLAIDHMKSLASIYKCQIMMVEIGTKSANQSLAKQIMTDFMEQARELDICSGVFYWEIGRAHV